MDVSPEIRQDKFADYLTSIGLRRTHRTPRISNVFPALDLFFTEGDRHFYSIEDLQDEIEQTQDHLLSHHIECNYFYTPRDLSLYHRLSIIESQHVGRSCGQSQPPEQLYSYEQIPDFEISASLPYLSEMFRVHSDAHLLWEHHDAATLAELKEAECKLDESFRPAMHNEHPPTPSDADPCSLTQVAPASRFKDSIDLQFVGSSDILKLQLSRPYANNLSAVITSKSGEQMLVVAVLATLYFHPFDPLTHQPENSPVLQIVASQEITTFEEDYELAWPYQRHTWNHIKTHTEWLDHEILVACGDSGRVKIWDSDTLFQAAQRKLVNSRLKEMLLKPQLELKAFASAWGVDFAKCVDSSGKVHRISVVSYNSRQVGLFYYNEDQMSFSLICTDLLPNNVPDVSFLSYVEKHGEHIAVVSMACVSKDLINYAFQWRLDSPNVVNVKSIKIQPLATVRGQYGCWTTRPIDVNYFKKVQSYKELTGETINEGLWCSNILRGLRALRLQVPDPKWSSSLGVTARWQELLIRVTNLEGESPNDADQDSEARTQMNLDLKLNRCRHSHDVDLSKDPTETDKILALKILAVSTWCDVALFRADTLLCCAKTKEVFSKKPYLTLVTSSNNRIQLSTLVPELSSMIVATQLGMVAIFRLCQYQGVYAMRQEHIFPNLDFFGQNNDRERVLVGISVKKLSAHGAYPRFFLYVTYLEGTVLTYCLQDKLRVVDPLEF